MLTKKHNCLILIYFFVIFSSISGFCDEHKLQLIDAQSAKPIANQEIRVDSDNGIRCFRAPCNTDFQRWTGNTNAEGWIEIPQEKINKVTSITCENLKIGRGLEDEEPSRSGGFILDLEPTSSMSQRRFKLLDAKTRKPLSNLTIWIVHEETCTPPICNEFTFTGKTNSIGNVFYPISKTWNPKYSEYWLYAPGYKTTRVEGSWANFKVLLNPK